MDRPALAALFLAGACALDAQETQRLEVLQPGPVRTGVALPAETGSLVVLEPGGERVPSQWRWQTHGAPGARRRFAVLCFEAASPGSFRIACRQGRGPTTLDLAAPGFPPPLLGGVPLAAARERPDWTGPVCAVQTLSGSGGPAEGLWWWGQAEAWACGEVRLTLEIAWLRHCDSEALELALPLPPGPLHWQVARGGGRLEEAVWKPLPAGTRLAPGEAWLSRLRGSLRPTRQLGPRWADQPGRPAGRAPFDRLPGGPAALPAFAAAGLAGPDRALDQALRAAVGKLLAAERPRDRGDLKDRHGAWLNQEYDLAWAFVLHFQRTGAPLFLEAALEALDHSTSTDRACLDRTGAVRGLAHVHGPEHRGRGTESGHLWLQGQLGAALLAGDDRLIARAAETVFAVIGLVQDGGGSRIGRSLGWPFLALAAWEEWTGAEVAGYALQRLARTVADAWSEADGAFLLPGERLGPGLWLVTPWVQAGLLSGPAAAGAPRAPWGARIARLLHPPAAAGCTESLVLAAGGEPRPGRRASLPHLALALEGSAGVAAAEDAWQKEARLLARGLEETLRAPDGRELAQIGRAWPVVALGRMGARDQRNVRLPR